MDDVFESIKKGAYRAKDETEKFAKAVVEKSSSLINQTKLKCAISENEDKIKELLVAMGEIVYHEYQNGAELTGDIGDKCNSINTLRDEIITLNEKIAKLKDNVICPSCGEYNPNQNTYCSKCGTKLEY